jgi:transposase-like protein
MPQSATKRSIEFSPEATANIRQRYVETNESMDRIAADFGVHRETIGRLAKRQGWPLRRDRPPRGLPVALQLDLAAAETLKAARGLATPAQDTGDVEADAPSLALRLEQAVERELAKVERLKEETGSETSRSQAAERIARTLSALTQTLFKVRALREPGRVTADEPDDMPADIDRFRDALARRIEAFVASRADDGLSAADGSAGAAPPAA